VGEVSHVSLRETALRLMRLEFWTSPVALFAWGFAFAALARARRLSFLDFVFPATVLGFMLYGGHGGWQYGPRYLFEAWPFAVLTALRAAEPLLFAPRAAGRPAPASRAAAFAASALLAHLAYQLAYTAPRFLLQRQYIVERQRLYENAEAQKLSNAVVFIRGPGPGSRAVDDVDQTRNGLDPAADSVIYVLDGGERNAEVLATYPGRRPYIYEKGVLKPILPEPAAARARAGGGAVPPRT
jgi:hypothetical protein